ncbi:MAG: ATP-binding protein [Rhodothermales bacterium]
MAEATRGLAAGSPGAPLARFSLRQSIFWKVAGMLVGVQIVTALLAIALSHRAAYDQSLALAKHNLRLRLDALASEVEQRTSFSASTFADVPLPLEIDLASRFPDPVTLLDAEGRPLRAIPPGASVEGEPGAALTLPSDLGELLEQGEVVVEMEKKTSAGTWAVAPVYDRESVLAGGVLVQPLGHSIAYALADTRAAYWQKLGTAAGLSALVALALGGLCTWWLVRPIRQITRQAERVEGGTSLPMPDDDEIGRLRAAVDRMGWAVQESAEALHTADALRRELLAHIGYDFRKPLTALIDYSEKAERHLEAGDQAAALEALRTSEQQERRLRQLVEDLFELAMLDSALAPLRLEPILLVNLLEDVASTHKASFHQAGIDFALERDPVLPVIQGDRVRLHRLLNNLLDNARAHTPPGGTVRLSAALAGENVRIGVTDTGGELPSEELSNVFERHYTGGGARMRVDEASEEAEEKSLELPISRSIARAHGGDVVVSNQQGGLAFTLELPMALVENS